MRTRYLGVTTGETRREAGNLKEAGQSLLHHLRELLLVLEAPGVASVSKPSPCHDKPPSSPVPRPGWAGTLHNVPPPSPHISRVTSGAGTTKIKHESSGLCFTQPSVTQSPAGQ